MIFPERSGENVFLVKNITLFNIQLSPLLRILKIAFASSALHATIIFLQRIINAIIPTIQVIIIAAFINNVLQVVNNGQPIELVYWPLFGIICSLAVMLLSEKMVYFSEIKLKNRMREKFSFKLVEKYGQLAFKNLENTEKSNLISRVLEKPEEQLIDGFRNITNFMSLIITISGIIVILLSYVWWTAILLVIVTLPLFLLAVRSGKANYEVNRETTKLKRIYTYFGEVLTKREGLEERSLFGYENTVNKNWIDSYEEARKRIFSTELKWFSRMKLGGMITSVISLVIMLVLMPSVLTNQISIGIYIALVNATSSLVNRMTIEFTQNLDEIAQNLEFSKDIQEYLLLEEVPGANEMPALQKTKFQSLQFNNVSFKYPGTNNYILKNMSFLIETGVHYAFVGINGAGKSTIIKLITGLYSEFEGEILINKVPIENYSQAELKSFFSVAYQDFNKYNISLKDNISLGNINMFENNNVAIKDAIDALGLETLVNDLPNGIDTTLGKLKKDSVDLSGGQWQKIALARFVVNPASVKVLDEPTSALDPITESQLYEKFEQVSKGNTTIFISHRLGSTKLADKILVINDGTIAESGSHQELLNNNALYSKLYQSQKGWYE